MSLGEVCSHGSLKRQCMNCELIDQLNALVADADKIEKQLQAADELAKAAREAKTGLENLYHAYWDRQFPKGRGPIPVDDLVQRNLTDALDAYEKAREVK